MTLSVYQPELPNKTWEHCSFSFLYVSAKWYQDWFHLDKIPKKQCTLYLNNTRACSLKIEPKLKFTSEDLDSLHRLSNMFSVKNCIKEHLHFLFFNALPKLNRYLKHIDVFVILYLWYYYKFLCRQKFVQQKFRERKQTNTE